jgi:hypothetical protein
LFRSVCSPDYLLNDQDGEVTLDGQDETKSDVVEHVHDDTETASENDSAPKTTDE